MNVTFETGGDGSTATTHDWLTPPEILEALGPFDMDPCASQFQPWRTAAQQFTIEDDGLAREWRGRVWCNPPYGPHAEKFLARMAAHGNGLKFTHGVEAFSGVIDSDFRGSVRVLLESAGDHYESPPLRINPGDRVAQASLVPAPRVTFTVVEQLSLTERGAGGFGSTGL